MAAASSAAMQVGGLAGYMIWGSVIQSPARVMARWQLRAAAMLQNCEDMEEAGTAALAKVMLERCYCCLPVPLLFGLRTRAG